MRQRIDHRRVNSKYWVEKVGQTDPVRLRDQAKERAVAIETPWSAVLDHFEPGFVVAVQQLIGNFAIWCLVGKLERLRPEPLNVDDRYQRVRQDPADGGVRLKVFELDQGSRSLRKAAPCHAAARHEVMQWTLPEPGG